MVPFDKLRTGGVHRAYGGHVPFDKLTTSGVHRAYGGHVPFDKLRAPFDAQSASNGGGGGNRTRVRNGAAKTSTSVVCDLLQRGRPSRTGPSPAGSLESFPGKPLEPQPSG